jgi:hypothetical protein
MGLLMVAGAPPAENHPLAGPLSRWSLSWSELRLEFVRLGRSRVGGIGSALWKKMFLSQWSSRVFERSVRRLRWSVSGWSLNGG